MDIETKCCSVTQTRIVMILSKKKNDKNVLLRRQGSTCHCKSHLLTKNTFASPAYFSRFVSGLLKELATRT